MSGEIAFANTALESFAALVTFVLLFACIAKIKMQRGIKHVTSKEAKRNTLDYILIIWLVIHMIMLTDVLCQAGPLWISERMKCGFYLC